MDRRSDRLNRAVARTFAATLTAYTRPSTGEVVPSVKGVFDRAAYRRERDPAGFDLSVTQPRLDLEVGQIAALADPRPLVNDTFCAEGSTWQIVRVDPGVPGSYACWCDEVNA